MSGLVACPFCRQMFETSEARACPECGLALESLAKLPPSYDAKLDEPDEPIPPHMETLPWTYVGRNRALLLAIALVGLLCFFAPWVRETAPELRAMSGFGLARKLGWMWAPGVAFFVMMPLVATRRSIFKMRGARVAVAFLAAIVLTTVGVRLAFTPHASTLRPVRFEWAWGLYATGVAGLAALAAAFGFGGRVDDVPTVARAPDDAVLH
ncbi:MAG TPA: hypothetical protein VHB21_19685 [Minicystis sp.]|nr:hypothetical protein [Minicystis sp.]